MNISSKVEGTAGNEGEEKNTMHVPKHLNFVIIFLSVSLAINIQ